MRVAFVSNCDPASVCAIGAVAEHHEVVVLRPVTTGTRRRRIPRDPARAVVRIARQRWYGRHFQRVDDHVQRALGTQDLLARIEVVDVARSALREDNAGELLRRRGIDVLVVSGGPVLKPHFYEAADLAVNLHMGLMPHYRGEHTLFWPLRRGEWERVGATLHVLDEGIDTGAVLSRVYPALSPTASEADVWARAAAVLADELVAWLDAWSRGADIPCAEMPRVTGTMVRYADRRLYHDAMWAVRRSLPALRPPHRPTAVERRWVMPPDA